MPQLDFSTLFQQLFWLIVSFSILYIAMWKIILPKISSVILERSELTSGYKEKALEMEKQSEDLKKKYNDLLNKIRLEAKQKIDEAKENAYKYHYEQSKIIDAQVQKKLDKSFSSVNNEVEEAKSELLEIASSIAKRINSLILGNR